MNNLRHFKNYIKTYHLNVKEAEKGVRSISSVDVADQASLESTNKQSGNNNKKHKNHILNKDWKALSMAEREHFRQGRPQNDTNNKRQLAFVGTSEDGEVEETLPNAGTQLGKQVHQKKEGKS